MMSSRSRTVSLVRHFCKNCLPDLNKRTSISTDAAVLCRPTRFTRSVELTSRDSFRNYVTDVDSADVDTEEFGKLAEKEGVTVFKLPPELRFPKEKDEDEKPRPRFFSRNTPQWYFLKCKNLAKENKIKECLQFFEEKMLKEDRVFPEEKNYTVVIGALARRGHVRKAFQLYTQMRDRAIEPSMATYTALFNAVAQSPDSKDLRKAISLYTKLHRNKIRMNRITYNSLIKAFGRHGASEQMMGIFRESITAGFEPDSETFNMILLSLLKNKDDGFRHAIEVWRQMLMLDIKPDGKSILYLLKVMKNCGIGDPQVAHRKLVEDMPDPNEYKDYFKRYVRNVYWLKGQQSKPKFDKQSQLPPEPEMLTLKPGVLGKGLPETEMGDEGQQSNSSAYSKDGNIPLEDNDNSIVYKPVADVVMDSTISMVPETKNTMINLLQLPFDKISGGEENFLAPLEIRKCNLPFQRLSLIGGHKHILEMFETHEIKPTIMVLSTLVQILPYYSQAENDVVEFAEKHSVKLDADFFNLILRNRAARLEKRGSQEILNKMVTLGLSPNYRTWCVSALSCVQGAHGASLINEAKNANVDLNYIFFNSLICAALKNKATLIEGYEDVAGYDYRYLCRILQEMRKGAVKPNQRTITLLEQASSWPEGYNRWKMADTEFERKVFYFRKQYNDWLETVEVTEED